MLALTEDPTTTLAERRVEPGRSLLVVAGAFVATFPLPETGTLEIGRSPAADLFLDHPSVSRTHASIRIDDSGAMTIEDRGSANGTFVRGERLAPGAPCSIAVGDVAELTEVRIVVREGRVTEPTTTWTHARLEARLEHACETARRDRRTSPSLVRVRIDGPFDRLVAHALFATLLGPSDAIAGDGTDFELLFETGSDAIDSLVDRLRVSFERRAMKTRIGVASFPRDGLCASELVAAAADNLRATPRTTAAVLVPEGPMAEVLALVDRIAASDVGCSIVGETGVGKEVLAARIHARSSRRHQPFVQVSAALDASVQGALDHAKGGTLLLDEIGDMPAALQTRLVRVLEGDRRNIRFLVTTSRDLEAEVARGALRADLYYRVAALVVKVPPLRERTREIAGLARTFLRERRPSATFDADAIAALEAHPWPGNVRELRNVVVRAAVLSGATDTIGVTHLGLAPVSTRVATTPPPTLPSAGELRSAMEDFERERIVAALEKAGGNQTGAAKLLGLSRGALVARITAYGLPRPRKDRRPA